MRPAPFCQTWKSPPTRSTRSPPSSSTSSSRSSATSATSAPRTCWRSSPGAAAPLPGGGEATEAGSRAAADFWRCAQEAGFRALCEALSFSGLQQELPRLFVNGVTVIAPSDAAFAQLSPAARGNFKLVRQLLLAHICPGTHLLEELQSKACAVSLAGQTHAVYARDGGTCVGSARLGRTDVAFEGGIIHEVDSVLVVLRFLRDAHTEQVWKKSLQPSPTVSICGGEPSMTNEFEVHGCLLHNATGQLVPEGLRGHIRRVGSLAEEQIQTFAELCVMTKPPSLAKRRGQGADGTNRYRLLFSLWNSSTLNYVSWQHMSTPLVVRNSFHMLPLEEKNYRRQQQYSRSRGRSTDALVPGAGASEIDESYGATSARRAARCPLAPRALPPTAPLLSLYSRMGRRCPTRAIPRNSAQFAATLADAAPARTGSGELALPSLPESTSLSSQELAPALMHSGSMDPTWMPLSQAGGLEPPMVGGAQKLRERTQSYGSASDDGSSVAGATVATRESAGNLAAEFAFLTTPEHQANQMSNLAATHEAAHSSELRRGSSGLQVPPPAAAAPVSAPLPSPTSNPHLQARRPRRAPPCRRRSPRRCRKSRSRSPWAATAAAASCRPPRSSPARSSPARAAAAARLSSPAARCPSPSRARRAWSPPSAARRRGRRRRPPSSTCRAATAPASAARSSGSTATTSHLTSSSPSARSPPRTRSWSRRSSSSARARRARGATRSPATRCLSGW